MKTYINRYTLIIKLPVLIFITIFSFWIFIFLFKSGIIAASFLILLSMVLLWPLAYSWYTLLNSSFKIEVNDNNSITFYNIFKKQTIQPKDIKLIKIGALGSLYITPYYVTIQIEKGKVGFNTGGDFYNFYLYLKGNPQYKKLIKESLFIKRRTFDREKLIKSQ